MLRQGGTLSKTVGSQLPNVFIIPRTVNLKYKENDRLLSCYYLQLCTSLRTNNSMPIFVFFFGRNKCRGHIPVSIITWCYKCQIGHYIKRNDRNLRVNRLRNLVIKFQKNKSSVCTIFCSKSGRACSILHVNIKTFWRLVQFLYTIVYVPLSLQEFSCGA